MTNKFEETCDRWYVLTPFGQIGPCGSKAMALAMLEESGLVRHCDWMQFEHDGAPAMLAMARTAYPSDYAPEDLLIDDRG